MLTNALKAESSKVLFFTGHWSLATGHYFSRVCGEFNGFGLYWSLVTDHWLLFFGGSPHISVCDVKYVGFSDDLEPKPLIKSHIFV